MSLLTIENISHNFGEKQLYDQASLQLNKGEHMGIIGQNGAGKSTLIKLLTGEIIPDDGQIKWQKNCHIGYLDQYAKLAEDLTIIMVLQSAFSGLYEQASQMEKLYADYAETLNEQLLVKAGQIQDILDSHDFYQIDAKIAQIATGLGLDAIGLDKKMTALSGGQRTKVILAKLLLEQPDVLLLDEPTNHLDVTHVEWLAGYLESFPGSFMVISHDEVFLNKIVNCVAVVDFGKISRYEGNLERVKKQIAEQKAAYEKAYALQQQKIQKEEAYIRKYKAGSRSTQAKSREKQLAKVDRLVAPELKSQADIVFPYQPCSNSILLQTDQLTVGYDQPLLKQLNFSLAQDEKIVLQGFNGIGKSTLLKTLLGEIPSMDGAFHFAENVVVNYFSQDLKWTNKFQTAIAFISEKYPKLSQKEIRSHLARCGLDAKLAMRPIQSLSGGEQVKIKLCLATLQPSNLLMFDEPTNHLDDATKQALQIAFQNFHGALILVTHEEYFYDTWIDRVLHVQQ